MPDLVDAHAHFFGPVFFETLAALADPGGDPAPGLDRLRLRGVEVPEDSARHARRWLAEMERAGVGRMIFFASVPEEAPSLAEAAAASGGRLVAFGVIHPAAPGARERVAYLARELGFRGLVLFPAMHAYDLSDPQLDGFYREVEIQGLPLVVHLGKLSVPAREILGLPSNFDVSFATPARLRGACTAHPGIQFIVPHFGGTTFAETLALAADCPNLALDTSSSNTWIRREPGLTLADVFRRSLEILGAERLHFGTDSGVFPRGWRDEVYAEQRAALLSLGLGAREQEAILAGNTLDLLKGRR